MSKARVPKHGNPIGYIVVETEATVGATIGTNLFNADGTLFDLGTFTQQVAERQSAGVGTSPSGENVIAWTAVQSVPANLKAIVLVTEDGFLRKSGANWTASPIVNADLAGATTAGLAEATNLYFTDGRADARITAWLATLAILPNAVDDTAAAGAGVAVGGLYRNGSVLMIRIT